MRKIASLVFIIIAVFGPSQLLGQYPFCYQYRYFDVNAYDMVYTKSLPTPWWAVRMTLEPDSAEVDTVCMKFGVTRPASASAESLQIRILAPNLPTITILDSMTILVPANISGQIPDSYYLVELAINAKQSPPRRYPPPFDFYVSWRLKGPSTHIANIYFKAPAINASRSLVINTNGTVTNVSAVVRPQIQDSVDLYAEARVCYKSNPFPVELAAFTATYQNHTAVLHWMTATEVNNYGFEIQRLVGKSENSTALLWEKIGFYPGHGTTTQAQSYSFTDVNPRAVMDKDGYVSYRLVQVDFNGQSANLPVQRVFIPQENSLTILNQNYPNPVSRSAPSTEIGFTMPSASQVRLDVYDPLGRLVSTITDEHMEAGMHSVMFNAASLTPGIYFYTIRTDTEHYTKRMTVTD